MFHLSSTHVSYQPMTLYFSSSLSRSDTDRLRRSIKQQQTDAVFWRALSSDTAQSNRDSQTDRQRETCVIREKAACSPHTPCWISLMTHKHTNTWTQITTNIDNVNKIFNTSTTVYTKPTKHKMWCVRWYHSQAGTQLFQQINVQLQNSLIKFVFPSYWHVLSKCCINTRLVTCWAS